MAKTTVIRRDAKNEKFQLHREDAAGTRISTDGYVEIARAGLVLKAEAGGTGADLPQQVVLRTIHFNDVDGLPKRCIALVGPAIDDPDSETPEVDPNGIWLGGTGGSATITKQYVLKEVFDDYLRCRSYYEDADGTPHEGETDVLVAKQYKHRNSLESETQLDVEHTYTIGAETLDANDIDNRTRTDSVDGEDDEDQMVTPVWVKDDLIYAMRVDHTNVWVDEEELKLIVAADSRVWMQVQ